MRFKAILGEVARNFSSNTSRSLLLTFLLALAACATGLPDVLAAKQIEKDAVSFRAAAASVYVLNAPGRVRGNSCDALVKIAGVQSAGALKSESRPLSPLATPENAIPLKQVTPGLLALLEGQDRPRRGGLFVSAEVASTLRLAPSRWLALSSGGRRSVAGVFRYPDDGRNTGLAYSALVVTSRGHLFDQCWVDVWPYSQPVIALAMLSVAGVPNASAVDISQLNSTLGQEYPGGQRFQHRPTAAASLLALPLGVLVGILAVVPRRLELAGALHLGVRRRDQVLQMSLEYLVWCLSAALIGAALLLLAAGFPAQHDWGLFRLGSRSIGSALIGALAGVIAAMSFVREELFFRFFKNR